MIFVLWKRTFCHTYCTSYKGIRDQETLLPTFRDPGRHKTWEALKKRYVGWCGVQYSICIAVLRLYSYMTRLYWHHTITRHATRERDCFWLFDFSAEYVGAWISMDLMHLFLVSLVAMLLLSQLGAEPWRTQSTSKKIDLTPNWKVRRLKPLKGERGTSPWLP